MPYQPTKCETTDDCGNNENLQMLTCIPVNFPKPGGATVGPGKCFPLPPGAGVKSKCTIDADCGNDQYACYAYEMDDAIDGSVFSNEKEPFITPLGETIEERMDGFLSE